MSSQLTLPEFIHRWQASTLSERSAAQSHFHDLCEVLGQPHPAAADQTGTFYTFEKGAVKTSGGDGWADVWLRHNFGWEYKGKHKSLAAAYQQLLQYREDLENPPLLVVCDMDRFEVHTNFTDTAKHVYAFSLADLANPIPTPTSTLPPLEVLRALFEGPDQLRPQQTTAQVTEAAATEFAKLAESLRRYGADPEQAARFLMRLLFCLFSEDIGLLPSHVFAQLVRNMRMRPAEFRRQLQLLFAAMASGGGFGVEHIAYFNGSLFADDQVFDLTTDDMEVLSHACDLDWSSIEPAIFGTLFERSLDPAKRSQLGAHYTSRDDILLIVEPVLMAPLRHRWEEVKQQAEVLIAKRDAERGTALTPQQRRVRTQQQQELQRLLTSFTGELASIRILDSACGSGNFLYVALKRMLDLEKEVITYAASNGIPAPFPRVEPHQLYGIEVNVYAHELAQVVVWIGYIQWLHDNGFGIPSDPILKPLHNIEEKDAVLAWDEARRPYEPEWPAADVIIGNPPFLGGKRMRTELGDRYTEALFTLYDGRVPREADFVTYWFERARELVAEGRVHRAGLLATNSIRGGPNRRVLERIKQTGDIFMAWGDRSWVLDGASVRVSMVGFDDGSEQSRSLDSVPVQAVNSDLTGELNLTIARRLTENVALSYMGDTKGGAFDIPSEVAVKMLAMPRNPNGRPNTDVVRPWVNGLDITRRPRGMWIIDFGVSMTKEDAALYETPFAHIERNVRPERLKNNRAAYRDRWWIHVEPRPAMRESLAPLPRYIGTPTLAKHRLFVWLEHPTLPDHQLIVIARDDDYFLGVLHSKLHELWALRMGTSLEDRPRYTPTSTFETFPFPWLPGHEPIDDPGVAAIAAAAQELVGKRDRWLRPEDATDAQLHKRTLTNLYNERPTWLTLAHGKLDDAVLAAYGRQHDLSDEQILERLLALNLEREPI